jgi:tRNA(adenine34) deaminase
MQDKEDIEYMRLAIKQAELAQESGEVPVGAVVVLDGAVIGTGHNGPIGNNDPSSHAEMVAIRSAAKHLKNYRMPGASLYVTLEPCLMCSGAIMHARISRLIYGTKDPKTGCVHSVLNVFDNKQLNHHAEIKGDVLSEECSEILKDFFRGRR